MLTRLRLGLFERLARWARHRQGEDALPLRLRARRLYILPTPAGYMSGVLLFVMLVAGLNYSNSLALLLTFLLGSFVLVGMHECQRTLQGLELLRATAADCHAGEQGGLDLRFANPARSPRRALTVRSASGAVIYFDLGGGAQTSVQVPQLCPRRGRHRIGRLELATTAPLGLFRCWTWLHLPVEVIVYPRPLGLRPLPAAERGRPAQLSSSAPAGEEEWAHLRAYQQGDSPRSIAWKTVARGGPLMVGQYAGATGSDHCLSFAHLEDLDLEARLSQLCAWVDECTRTGAAFELDLPAVRIPVGRGAPHRLEALRALALYPTAPR